MLSWILDFTSADVYSRHTWFSNSASGVVTISTALYQSRSELLHGFEAYSIEGWDGYDAEPLSKNALDAARDWLDALPHWIPNPDIAPGADGSIGIDWTYDFGSLYVDVYSDGSLRLFQDIDNLWPRDATSKPDPDAFSDRISPLLDGLRPSLDASILPIQQHRDLLPTGALVATGADVYRLRP